MNIGMTIKLGLLVTTLTIALVTRYIFHKPQEIIEDVAEDLIEDLTGVEVDFDGSKEHQKEKKKREELINRLTDLDDVD